MPFDLCFMIGGEAGQGVQSAGYMLARALARSTLSVFADQDYESRIRGGHNFFRVRASEKDVSAAPSPPGGIPSGTKVAYSTPDHP